MNRAQHGGRGCIIRENIKGNSAEKSAYRGRRCNSCLYYFDLKAKNNTPIAFSFIPLFILLFFHLISKNPPGGAAWPAHHGQAVTLRHARPGWENKKNYLQGEHSRKSGPGGYDG